MVMEIYSALSLLLDFHSTRNDGNEMHANLVKAGELDAMARH
jgi:hypothetical protein